MKSLLRALQEHWRWLFLVLAALLLIGGWFVLPVKIWLLAFEQWIRELGWWGWWVFAAIYALAAVVLFPCGLLTLVAGLAFGLPGFWVVMLGAGTGASIAFAISRYLLRGGVARRLGHRRRFQAVDEAVRKEGWKIVGLLRMSPLLPFAVQNYLYGLTSIHFWPYLGATLAGIAPGTLLFIYIGAAGRALLTGGDGEHAALKWIFFAVGLLATAAVSIIVTFAATRKLHEMGVDEEESLHVGDFRPPLG